MKKCNKDVYFEKILCLLGKVFILIVLGFVKNYLKLSYLEREYIALFSILMYMNMVY